MKPLLFFLSLLIFGSCLANDQDHKAVDKAINKEIDKADSAPDAGSVQLSKLTPEQLEPFFDGIWLSYKSQSALMGGVVMVVKDGQVLFEKGYGYADYEAETKVDPDTSMFRIASISKPFTWVAVMQLVEQGKLDLNEDINHYLKDFQIEYRFGKPITMAHLMSHTAGFEDKVLDLGRDSADKLVPLGEYLASHLPEQVRPPGSQSSYSNHSTALAAHIVANVSGEDWSDYLEQHILEPLGMNHTAVRHPFPEHLEQDRVKSFRKSGGKWLEEDFLYWLIYPAGMVSASALDMSKFMNSLLGFGPQVIDKSTMKIFYEPLYRPFPGANAWAHGLYEVRSDNPRAIGHGGDLNGFHSQMLLIPEINVGIFTSFNSEQGSRIRSAVGSAIMNWLGPLPDDERGTPNTDLRDKYSHLKGTYAPLRRSVSDFAKLSVLVNHATVRFDREGYLKLKRNGRVTLYTEIGDHSFRANDGSPVIHFQQEDDGRIYLQRSLFPAGTLEQLDMKDSPSWHRLWFLIVTVSMLFYLIYWPVRWINLYRQGKKFKAGLLADAPPRLPFTNKVLESLAWFTSLGTIATLALLATNLSNERQFLYEVPDNILALLKAVLVLAVMSAVVMVGALALWLQRPAHPVGSSTIKIHLTLVGTAGLFYALLNYYWNTLTYFF